jgi:glycerate kinase
MTIQPRRLLAAADKFRGTATAAEVCEAAADAARRAGLLASALPLSDGGEGFLEAMGGTVMRTLVTGPLGAPVEAEWRLLGGPQAPVAVIEMAAAAGLLLAGGAEANDPVRATTAGVGELLVAAWRAGARDIIVGCGGSATTDGGAGAVDVVQTFGGLPGTRLRAATDVRTRFVDAAAIFGPQKGADPPMVAALTGRLEGVAERYLREFGVDVRSVEGSGAAGGLSGGLVALGASIYPGFDVVADTLGLDSHLAAADIVVTGEGKLDATSLEGKVVGGVLRRVAAGTPVLIVVGDATDGIAARIGAISAADVTVVPLLARYGRKAAFARPLELIREVITEALQR